MIDRRLQWLAIGVFSLAIGCLSVVYANPWTLSSMVTVSIGCWLAGVLYAVNSPPNRRATAVAALLCSFLYLLLSGGPWFETHVGPWLLTTRALVAIDTQVLGHSQQAVTLQVAPAANWVYSTGWTTTYTVPQATTTALWQTGSPATSPSVAVGQWLLAWCAAAIGAGAARWLRRRQPGAMSAATFAEAAP